MKVRKLICAIGCFGALFLTGGCDKDDFTVKENTNFKNRVKKVEYISSHSNAIGAIDIVSFLEIDNHQYIFYCHNPGMNSAVGGLVHNPECKFCKEKK